MKTQQQLREWIESDECREQMIEVLEKAVDIDLGVSEAVDRLVEIAVHGALDDHLYDMTKEICDLQLEARRGGADRDALRQQAKARLLDYERALAMAESK
jgi:hypothetical protein